VRVPTRSRDRKLYYRYRLTILVFPVPFSNSGLLVADDTRRVRWTLSFYSSVGFFFRILSDYIFPAFTLRCLSYVRVLRFLGKAEILLFPSWTSPFAGRLPLLMDLKKYVRFPVKTRDNPSLGFVKGTFMTPYAFCSVVSPTERRNTISMFLMIGVFAPFAHSDHSCRPRLRPLRVQPFFSPVISRSVTWGWVKYISGKTNGATFTRQPPEFSPLPSSRLLPNIEGPFLLLRSSRLPLVRCHEVGTGLYPRSVSFFLANLL